MAKRTSTINWTTGLLIKEFGLVQIFENFPLLDNWVSANGALSQSDMELLERKRLKLLENVNGWNEETLKMKFIAFVLDLADYDYQQYQGVFEAEVGAVVGNHKLRVITDFTVARVIQELIEHPYFYFHEYKPKRKSKDPIAQVLTAMLIAQELNKNGKPIYGCHVIGENWYFMVLNGREYAISEGISATNRQELQKILIILRKFKDILFNELLSE